MTITERIEKVMEEFETPQDLGAVLLTAFGRGKYRLSIKQRGIARCLGAQIKADKELTAKKRAYRRIISKRCRDKKVLKMKMLQTDKAGKVGANA